MIAIPRFLACRPFMAGLVIAGALPSVGAIEYEKDIMPIFMAKCAECHSDAEGKVKGGLKFDDPAHFHRRFAKNSVVVPGDFDASYLFLTLFRPADDKDAMPPEGKGERLTQDEVKLVLEWIQEGAEINGEKGAEGAMPEDMDDLLRDLPPSAGGTAGATPGEDNSGSDLPAMRQEEDWTNAEGQTIRATLVGVEDGFALLRMANGTVHRYPVNKLSEESRAKLKAAP